MNEPSRTETPADGVSNRAAVAREPADISSPRQRLLARMRAERDDLAARIVERARMEIADYGTIDAADLMPTTTAIMDRLFATLAGDAESGTGTQLTDYGRIRATQAVSMEALLRAWRLAERLIMDTLSTAADECGADDAVLLELTRDLLRLVDDAAASFADAHHEVARTRADHHRAQRAEFTRAVLTGTLTSTELNLGIQRYGLRGDAAYRAFRARADSAPPAEFDRLLRPSGADHAFRTVIDGDYAGFTDRTIRIPGTALLAFGPPRPLDDAPHSFRLAGRALATALAFGHTGSCEFDGLGLLPGVAADPELGAELVRRYVAPLGTTASAAVLIETVTAYLDTGMRIEATAQRLIVHPNTVRYRIGRFEELTACDLRRAHTGAQVWWAIQYHRLARPAATNFGAANR
ncbi:PucR family transcriptional regulator [Nocardia veterana]|uniref:PucR family transcriptional regulator n=1 Tax=Nocardia veterana TaxID=132249 RepID=A0A7X6LY76_9NOCA|nr:helix-turn-helix domain-containing protein [Nocardia veterana]NKY86728.1 PucR family transcriptional regulator [Nocardia veterana]